MTHDASPTEALDSADADKNRCDIRNAQKLRDLEEEHKLFEQYAIYVSVTSRPRIISGQRCPCPENLF